MDDVLLQAAAARAAGLNQITQRPSQRRCAAEPTARATARVPAAMSLRAADDDGDKLHFVGVASATERGYEMWDMFGAYTEVIDHAAFDETLARADLDVPLVLAHDQMRRIARTTLGTLRLDMVDEGLGVDADLFRSDPDVAYAETKLRAGLYDEMSFAFRIESGIWSPDYTEYRITKVDLHRGDVAIVGWGANPYTSAELRTEQRGGYGQRVVSLLDLAIATGGR